MAGSINHLSLTVRNVVRSEPFYDALLTFMGYQLVEKTEQIIMWWQPDGSAILIHAANPDSPNQVHDRYSPGLHHLAFNADSREQVDRLYQQLLDRKVTILDAPAEYSHYAPGYYAVFFADPDGIKLEFVHMPQIE